MVYSINVLDIIESVIAIVVLLMLGISCVIMTENKKNYKRKIARKTIDGVELLRMIRDEEIKEGTDIEDKNGLIWTYDNGSFWSNIGLLEGEDNIIYLTQYHSLKNLANETFKLSKK